MRMKGCLILSLWKFTGEEIGHLKEINKTLRYRYREECLPVYCFDDRFHRITDSESYLQFVEDGNDCYYLFDIVGADSITQYEIDHLGLELLFPDDELWQLLYLGGTWNLGRDYNRLLPQNTIIELCIECSGDYDDVECEISCVRII